MKLLEATVNWSHSAITFSMSLPRVLKRMIGWKAFGLLYDDLFGFGMTTMVDTLKYLGQCPRLMQASAILMILERQASFLTMVFQCCHVSLSGPGEDESAHLLIADKNSYLEKGPQFWDGFCANSWRISTLTWWWSTVLKVLYRAFYRLSGVRQGQLLCLMASIAGSFLFLTQFINSHGPQLLFVILWILSLKNVCLAFLTASLKDFQFLQLLSDLYVLRVLLQDSDHHCLECLEYLDFLAFLTHICSTIMLSWLTICSSLLMLSILDVSKLLKLEITSLMKSVSCSLFRDIASLDVWMVSSKIGMSIMRGARSEERCHSGKMKWLSSSSEPCQRNIRSITEFDSPAVSENLVRPGLVRDERESSKESAIIIRLSLIEAWKGKDRSHKLSLMLKSPIIRRTLLILTSVSLRYFKAKCKESE